MTLHTASEGITFSKKLENESALFYEGLAEINRQNAEIFLSFAADNKKFITQIERAYYGVITDAIEGCYAFNMEPADYELKTGIPAGISDNDLLGQAIEIEETIIRFYSDASEQSRSLMADVPRAFSLIARKRSKRLETLRSLAENTA